jgi:ATP phosphoribosyltransferase
MFSDEGGSLQFVPLKPADIPVYVASGAIDAGVVGSDILRETESDVYEPLDLRIGVCALVLAIPEGSTFDVRTHPTIATKYPRTAEKFFRMRNAHVHIVRLDGSVEIAPLLGLADAIVDLVETGRTLRENRLSVVEQVAQVSAKLIVNRTTMRLKASSVQPLISSLDRIIYATA